MSARIEEIVMETLHLRAVEPGHVARAAEILRAGGLVAFPTETVYGLGAEAFSRAAVERIFAAKQRPAWDPLIVHVTDLAAVGEIAAIPDALKGRVNELAVAFWPGPMTLLLPRRPAIPDAVTAGRALVGVRVPAHPAALALLRATGLPLAAPSANRFGHTSPTTAQHVLHDLGGRIEAVLDGGPCAVGLESTVLDPGQTPMVIYRAGAVTREALERATGVEATLFLSKGAEAGPEGLPSPGVGIRHYAPEAPVWLAEGTEVDLWRTAHRIREQGRPVGVLLPCDWAPRPEEGYVIQAWGRWADDEALGRELFSGLRSLEGQGVAAMVCPLPAAGGMRDALRDRLVKAALAR